MRRPARRGKNREQKGDSPGGQIAHLKLSVLCQHSLLGDLDSIKVTLSFHELDLGEKNFPLISVGKT